MSLAHLSTGPILIVFLTGAAWAAPTTPSSGDQTKIERDSQVHNELPLIKLTAENNGNESAATTLGVDLTSEFSEESECQNAWQKFIVDFGAHYASDTETQKRRGIFCENWKRIREHNAQYEVGKVSFKKKINQWADLTTEEWKNKQRPILSPEFAKAKPMTSEVDQTRIKCEAAWKKFLSDFSRTYENDAETEKRRSIFCNKWQRIEEHNLQYEAGKVSYKKSINQWSDLTFEEWRKTQKPHFPPNMETPGNKTEETNVKEHPQRKRFPANMEEPGTYVEETAIEPNGSDKIDLNNIKCQAAWEKFLVDFSPKYETDAETEKRRTIFCGNWQRIQGHNTLYKAGIESYMKGINQWSDLTFEEWRKTQKHHFPPSMETPGNKTEETNVKEHPQRKRFPANMEEPGTYVQETTIKPQYVKETQTVEAPIQIKEKEEKANKELPENKKEKGGSQQVLFPPNMEKPGTYINKPNESERTRFPANTEEPGTYVEETTIEPNGSDEFDQNNIRCQAAWEKFLVDFSPKYETDAETEKRLTIFCSNWQRIQEHNTLYNAGIESYMKGINQWSDLTFEELKNKIPYTFPPNMETPGNKTEETNVREHPQRTRFPANMEEPGTYVEEPAIKPIPTFEVSIQMKEIVEKANKELPGNSKEKVGSQQVWFPPNTEEPREFESDQKMIKCQAAWEKFLNDYTPKYENDAETRIRRLIFCDNWQKTQEHKELNESGGVSIDEWTDLTSKELKSQSPNLLPPNRRPPDDKREETIVQVGSQQIWFPPNMEDPGMYVKQNEDVPFI
ncbi:uncharacterized protein LOC110189518 isoform X1 [Drosophila serrata]|uniref:uncharacterized protein LOC110189518 isoform X1 n=1 Tax=Drosophila serrata TaxID=7274 RepID=UPI000A1D2C1B|nr:uncharacterized protein LOC110189518 isoform X1 [Drosophila serrata]